MFLEAALKNTCENIVPVQIKAIAVKFIIKHQNEWKAHLDSVSSSSYQFVLTLL